MLIIGRNLVCMLVILFGCLSLDLHSQKINPFERPGSRQKKPPPIIRPAPPPPAPKSINPNIELRGMFKFLNELHFSLFDRAQNKGAWLKMGESFDDGKVEIEGFNPDTEELKLKGGLSLSLKNASKVSSLFLADSLLRNLLLLLK